MPGDGEPVAPERLAREHGQDLEHDPEARQREDVDLGVAEEPEEVLVQVGAAAAAREVEGRVGGRGRAGPSAAPRCSTGAASAIRTDVVSTPQTKIGSRAQVMPGARIVMIVVIRLSPISDQRDAIRMNAKM